MGGGGEMAREVRDGGCEIWYTFGLEFWNYGIPLIRATRKLIKTFLLLNNVKCNLKLEKQQKRHNRSAETTH